MMNIQAYLALFAIAYFSTSANGHGRLLTPPSRSSMFRYAYTDPMLIPYRDVIQPNYDDNGLNCGGKQVQIDNNGKCGVCGDSYTAEVKENEAGGKYALGIITRNYKQGDFIDTTVEITAEHKGYFEFRLCSWNNIHLAVTQECLNEHLLTFENGDTKWYLPEDPAEAKGFHDLKVKLPQDVTCEQCVLQWRYRTGNSWGFEDGQQGLGFGQQEEFYGCSDFSIEASDAAPPAVSTTTSPATNTSISSTENDASDVTSTPSPGIIIESTHASESPESTTHIVTTSSSGTSESPVYYPDVDCSKEILGQPIFRDCHSFYICAFPMYDPFIFGCPEGTVCNPETAECDLPYNVPASCNTKHIMMP